MTIFVIAIFVIALISTLKKKWAVSTYLIGVYLLSLVFSVFLCNDMPEYRTVSVTGGLAFVFLLFFYFIPFYKKTPIIVYDDSTKFIRKFTRLGYLIGIFILIGMVLMGTKIEEVFNFGIEDVRGAMYSEGSDSYITSYTPLERIGSIILGWFGGLAYVLLLMFFYALAFIPKYWKLKLVLLISSLGSVYEALMVAGRTKLVYWLMFFFLYVIIFYPYITRKTKTTLITTSIVLLTFLFGYFGFITYSRTTMVGNDSSLFIIRYMGQSFPNFCNFWDKYTLDEVHLHRIFPFSDWLLNGNFDLTAYRNRIVGRTGLEIGIFYTLLGDLLVDIGRGGLLIYTFIFCFIACKFTAKRKMDFSDLLILVIILQIPLHGLFYYSLWRPPCTFDSVLTILFAFYLKNHRMRLRYN